MSGSFTKLATSLQFISPTLQYGSVRLGTPVNPCTTLFKDARVKK